MPNRQKSPEDKNQGIWIRPYEKNSETCPDLRVQVSEVVMKPTDADHTAPPPDHSSRRGLEGRSPLPDHVSRSPRRSGQANDAPIRGQLSSHSLSLYVSSFPFIFLSALSERESLSLSLFLSADLSACLIAVSFLEENRGSENVHPPGAPWGIIQTIQIKIHRRIVRRFQNFWELPDLSACLAVWSE